MRRFEFVEGDGGKFWEITQEATDVTVRFGKMGAAGQTKTKSFPTLEAATKDMETLVREKTKKGYVEVAASDAPSEAAPAAQGAQVDHDALVALLKKDGDSILGMFGELTLLPANQSSQMADHFTAGADGATWEEVFKSIEWIADEADGGALGWWTVGARRVIVRLDNEGQFELTGTSLLDHFAAMSAHDDEKKVELEAFVAKHKLGALRSEKARKADVAGIESPQARFDKLKASAAKAKPKSAPAKKATKLAPLGPRPLCSAMATGILSSGKLLLLVGEDTSVEPIDFRLGGRTYLFDRDSLASEEAAPMKPPDNHPSGLMPLTGDRALLIKPWRLYENGAWSDAPGEPIEEVSGHVHALADGSYIAFGSSRNVIAHRIHADGKVERIGDLPEPRSYDEMATLPDGRLWFGGGEAGEKVTSPYGERISFGFTRRTVILDPKSWTFSAGPELPAGVIDRGAFAGSGGRAMAIGYVDKTAVKSEVGVFVWDGAQWLPIRTSPELADGRSNLRVLRDGTVMYVRWSDGAIVTFAPETYELRIAGFTQLAQSSARVHELSDGRVLFIGGILYGNIPAEPEVWDRKTGECVALQGREKDAERQRAKLVKYWEKEKIEREKTRALLAAQAAARAAKG